MILRKILKDMVFSYHIVRKFRNSKISNSKIAEEIGITNNQVKRVLKKHENLLGETKRVRISDFLDVEKTKKMNRNVEILEARMRLKPLSEISKDYRISKARIISITRQLKPDINEYMEEQKKLLRKDVFKAFKNGKSIEEIAVKTGLKYSKVNRILKGGFS